MYQPEEEIPAPILPEVEVETGYKECPYCTYHNLASAN
jgi:uncharacterized protein (UPF0212 family)